MVANMDYFRLVRRTDPSYTAYSAFKEWMRTNRDTAVELAEQIWPEVDPNGYPMNWDDLSDCFRAMDPMDVFFEGYYSYPNCDSGDEYFIVEGDGHYRSLSYSEYEQECVDFMCSQGYEAMVLGDKYPVPRELADVLALWGKMVRTENRRPSTCKRGCTGCGACGRPVAKKAPSKNRKVTRQSKNTKSASTKSNGTKARSSNTRSSNTKSKSVKAKPKTGRR